MSIILQSTSTRWLWFVQDDEGHTLNHGSSADYIDACRAALSHFDEAKRKETTCP